MADVRDVNLNRLAVFVAVVDAGSVTGAASRLALTKTMVSAHLQRLEQEVGASLVTRTTRRLSVTEPGRAFYEASVKILQATEEALSVVSGESAPVRGTLRVTAPGDYGALVVAPALVALRDRHPALQVELVCNDMTVDLIAEGFDVAVRLGKLHDSNYRATTLGALSKALVASPTWLARWKKPKTLDALAALPMVALSVLPNPTVLSLQHRDGTQRKLKCTNAMRISTADATRAATVAGGGFALLTDFSIAADVAEGRLVRLFPDWSSMPSGIHAVYPPTTHPSPKVRAFIEILRETLRGV